MSIDIGAYRSELRKYQNLKNNISEILPKLEKAINAYDDMGNILRNIYIIDDDTTLVYEKSVELKNKLEDTSKKLKNDILPKINKKINFLHIEIINYKPENSEE